MLREDRGTIKRLDDCMSVIESEYDCLCCVCISDDITK